MKEQGLFEEVLQRVKRGLRGMRWKFNKSTCGTKQLLNQTTFVGESCIDIVNSSLEDASVFLWAC